MALVLPLLEKLGKDKNSFFTVQKNSVIAYSGLINLIFL